MKRNKKIKKNASWTMCSIGVVVLLICMLMMVLAYWLCDARCAAIQREINKAEMVYKALDTDCVREMARWDKMRTFENLDNCLTRFGLEMKIQRPDQIVRMNRDGRPAPNQIAVSRARMRARGVENMASYKSGGRTTAAAAPRTSTPRGTRR